MKSRRNPSGERDTNNSLSTNQNLQLKTLDGWFRMDHGIRKFTQLVRHSWGQSWTEFMLCHACLCKPKHRVCCVHLSNLGLSANMYVLSNTCCFQKEKSKVPEQNLYTESFRELQSLAKRHWVCHLRLVAVENCSTWKCHVRSFVLYISRMTWGRSKFPLKKEVENSDRNPKTG